MFDCGHPFLQFVKANGSEHMHMQSASIKAMEKFGICNSNTGLLRTLMLFSIVKTLGLFLWSVSPYKMSSSKNTATILALVKFLLNIIFQNLLIHCWKTAYHLDFNNNFNSSVRNEHWQLVLNV